MQKQRSIIFAQQLVLISSCMTVASTNGLELDSEPAKIENIVVTGTRLSDTAADVYGRTTTIDRHSIESRNNANVLDLLRSTAGIHISQYGGRGGVSSVFLQGAEPNFTVVTIDGVKVNDPNNSRGGSFNFATLNLAEIERVEIVRGVQSSIYGSDGLSGLINIVTRAAHDNYGLTFEVEAGEDDHLRNALHASAPLNENHSISANYSIAEDGESVPGNDFKNQTASLRLQGRSNLAYDLNVRFADSESTSFPEDSGGPKNAVLRTLDQHDHTQLSLSGNVSYPISERWQLVLSTTYLNQDVEFASPGIAPGVGNAVPPNASDAALDRFNISSHAVYEFSDGLSLAMGIDYQEEDGKQQGSLELFPGFSLPTDFRLDRETLGVFAEARYATASGFSASASLRRDNPSDQSAQSTTRLGAQYETKNTRYYVSWGEGFKLPSFFALGHGLVGNPLLRPETSKNWAIGINHQFGEHVQLDLSGFHNTFQNLIDFDFELFTNVNRNKVETQGFELSGKFSVHQNAIVSAHVTYVDIDVNSDGNKLRQRPDWRGGIDLAWQLHPRLSTTISWLYVDDVFDSSVQTGPTDLDSYTKLNTSITWQPSDRFDLWLAVDNVTGTSYEESVGFQAPGLRSRVGLRVHF